MFVSLSFSFGPSHRQRLPVSVISPPRLRLRYYDLCCLLAPPLARRRPFRHKARSPQVRKSSFPARPPDLRSQSFDHRGFSATGPFAPLGAASYPVFVHRPAVSLPASSPRLVALSQLQFASFGMVSFRGDFHPQDDVHAGRTRSAARAPHERFVDVTPISLRRLRPLQRVRRQDDQSSKFLRGSRPDLATTPRFPSLSYVGRSDCPSRARIAALMGAARRQCAGRCHHLARR
jgi:hypothetical protein